MKIELRKTRHKNYKLNRVFVNGIHKGFLLEKEKGYSYHTGDKFKFDGYSTHLKDLDYLSIHLKETEFLNSLTKIELLKYNGFTIS